MSTVTDNAQVNTPVDLGPALQCFVAAGVHGIAASVSSSGNIKSNVIATNGWKSGAIGLQSTQAGSLSLQRYVDQGGTVPIGAAITVNLVANTAAALSWSDGVPCGSVQLTVNNSGGSTATLSKTVVLLQSN